MAIGEIKVKIHVSRWFTWAYLPLFKMTVSLAIFVNNDYEPNLENLKYWASKSIKVVK